VARRIRYPSLEPVTVLGHSEPALAMSPRPSRLKGTEQGVERVRLHDLVFESTRTVTPKEFAEFVATREAAGDTGRYELLNGRVVMSPPAGCSPVSLATRSPRPSSSCAAARSSGKAIP
jgi:hypothetical protein